MQEKLLAKAKNAKKLSIVTDGWSNQRNEHMVNFVLTFPSESKHLLYSTICNSNERQTAENIAKDIEKIILEVGLEKVSAVVTDNASNMKAAWDILEEKYPRLFCNGCAAHTFNLLVKDVVELSWAENVISKAMEITTFVKSRTIILDKFNSLQNYAREHGDIDHARTLKFVCNTRWYSHHTCVSRVLENKPVLELLYRHSVVNAIDSGSSRQRRISFQTIIGDFQFWEDLGKLVAILEPTCKFIGVLESNIADLSNVYRIFKTLSDSWKDENELSTIVEYRWNFLHTESMGFAYFLDPKTKGKKF